MDPSMIDLNQPRCIDDVFIFFSHSPLFCDTDMLLTAILFVNFYATMISLLPVDEVESVAQYHGMKQYRSLLLHLMILMQKPCSHALKSLNRATSCDK